MTNNKNNNHHEEDKYLTDEEKLRSGKWKRESDVYGYTWMWYLAPIFFAWLGGIIMYFVNRKEKPRMAKIGLILGFVVTAIWLVVLL